MAEPPITQSNGYQGWLSENPVWQLTDPDLTTGHRPDGPAEVFIAPGNSPHDGLGYSMLWYTRGKQTQYVLEYAMLGGPVYGPRHA